MNIKKVAFAFLSAHDYMHITESILKKSLLPQQAIKPEVIHLISYQNNHAVTF